MAKIERYNGNVAAFASQADTNKRTTFGTTDTGDDTLDGNLTADYFTGWQIVGPNDSPTLEDFNGAMFTAGQFLSYLHQAGVPEWNGVQQYQIGSYVNRAGVLYVCKTADHVSVTAPESDGVNWDGLDSQFVALDGNQTINDIKNFTSSPTVPTPTTGTQAVNKAYVDGFVNQADILGTVSESAGAPTGALFESGSNSNGEYVKYADGTQICTLSITPASNNNSGTPFVFPAAFIAAPFAHAQGERISSSGINASNVSEIDGVTTTQGRAKVLVHTATTIADIVSVKINVIAIGRWF